MSGLLQGLGLGFIFVPLNTLAFATIAPRWRTDAAGLLTLLRGLGASIGISVVTALLSRNLQVSHADLASQVTPFTVPMVDPATARQLGGVGDTALAMLDLEVNRQALMIAYVDDFRLMMVICLALMPLILLLRRPAVAAGPPPAAHLD